MKMCSSRRMKGKTIQLRIIRTNITIKLFGMEIAPRKRKQKRKRKRKKRVLGTSNHSLNP